MRRVTKVVSGFAVAGFFLPLLIMTVRVIAAHFNEYPNAKLLQYLCPPLIVMPEIWGPTLIELAAVIFMVCVSNAALYACVSFAIVLVFRVIRRGSLPGGPLLR
jgi:hypothetical protein